MNTEFIQDGTNLTVNLTGQLDTTSVPALESQLMERWDGITNLIFNFSAVEYISSAGLRIMLIANKHMSKCGTMTLCNVNADIREIFAMTGFDTLLNFA